MKHARWLLLVCALVAGAMNRCAAQDGSALLEQRLLGEDAAALAADARTGGDARRGAILFHRAHMLCAKCHVAGAPLLPMAPAPTLGPDLARFDERPADRHLVEAILTPSAAIRRGYETVSLVTLDGQAITGLLAEERDDAVVVRDAAQDGKPIAIAKHEIEERAPATQSIMPGGLVNLLADRQEFLDLVCYLMEIAEHGAPRAAELRPDPALVAPPPVPEYEHDLDHAGLIAAWDKRSLERGQEIYQRLCINCHGTREQAGSLPTSLRFATGRFKNGSDPHSMYRTLTYGFGMMTPQAWMVPEQKYDVIHYIREAYLKPFNAPQYTTADRAYLASLPRGSTRGPKPSNVEPWAEMDYGPYLFGTYEIELAEANQGIGNRGQGTGDDGGPPSGDAPDRNVRPTGGAGAVGSTGGVELPPNPKSKIQNPKSPNIAYKGIAIRLDTGPGGVARGRHWIVYEHDTLRAAGAWSGRGFIDYHGISFDGRHNAHPHVVGHVHFSNANGPGWADPATGRFDDTRLMGRDGRRYGPLPRGWAQYRALDDQGDRVVLSYTVGEADILETPSLESPRIDSPHAPRAAASGVQAPNDPDFASDGPVVIARTLDLGAASHELVMRVAPIGTASAIVLPSDRDPSAANQHDARRRLGHRPSLHLAERDGHIVLVVPPRDDRAVVKVLIADCEQAALDALAANVSPPAPLTDAVVRQSRAAMATAEAGALPQPTAIASIDSPKSKIQNPKSLRRWPSSIRTQPIVGDGSGPFAVDTLTHPAINPWSCQMRFTGFDFVDADTIAIASWDGDVWLVRGIDRLDGELDWQRVASGLFQPLGVKVVAGAIYVSCRDQIVVLRDDDGDGETDRYECFNSDHQVTEHFHEFAMGLETDEAGNFYYAKSARHALPAIVPHHGTLLRVSRDGQRTDILATGFRAANGVCLNADGTFIVTDQEGHWNPKNRINWVTRGGFYGNMFGYHDVSDARDSAMQQPLCWITNSFDRSPSQLLWVTSEQWGPLHGSLLNFSYGYGKVYVVPHERVDGQMQGGMCELPIPAFPTGIMRGRFHPTNGHLYVCGMFSWAGSQTQPGGFYRIRATGRPVYAPIALHATEDGLTLGFTGELDANSAADARNYQVKVWSLRRTADYGSDHYDERPLAIAAAALDDDRRTVRLSIPQIAPTWCMEIRYSLRSAAGEPVDGVIHNTIHHLSHAAFGAARASESADPDDSRGR